MSPFPWLRWSLCFRPRARRRPRSRTHPLPDPGMTPWTTCPEDRAGRSRHHERRADLDHPVGRRYAAERLRLQRSGPAAAAFPVARAAAVLFSRVVRASQLRGRRSFADLGAAGCRSRDQRRWRPTPSVDLHVHVQPCRDPERPGPVSLRSDPAPGRVLGPCVDRCVTHAHDVQRRRSGLHVVDELSRPRRQSGIPVHYQRRRRHQHHGPGRAIHAAAGHAGDHGRQVGPGDAESGAVG